jgi:hypothetical protein
MGSSSLAPHVGRRRVAARALLHLRLRLLLGHAVRGPLVCPLLLRRRPVLLLRRHLLRLVLLLLLLLRVLLLRVLLLLRAIAALLRGGIACKGAATE